MICPDVPEVVWALIGYCVFFTFTITTAEIGLFIERCFKDDEEEEFIDMPEVRPRNPSHGSTDTQETLNTIVCM